MRQHETSQTGGGHHLSIALEDKSWRSQTLEKSEILLEGLPKSIVHRYYY
jgi:hypothetical protein